MSVTAVLFWVFLNKCCQSGLVAVGLSPFFRIREQEILKNATVQGLKLHWIAFFLIISFPKNRIQSNHLSSSQKCMFKKKGTVHQSTKMWLAVNIDFVHVSLFPWFVVLSRLNWNGHVNGKTYEKNIDPKVFFFFEQIKTHSDTSTFALYINSMRPTRPMPSVCVNCWLHPNCTAVLTRCQTLAGGQIIHFTFSIKIHASAESR